MYQLECKCGGIFKVKDIQTSKDTKAYSVIYACEKCDISFTLNFNKDASESSGVEVYKLSDDGKTKLKFIF